ncbi:MAG: NTP transferase domain-containing protein [Proteiniphilum sp.]
MEAKSKIGIILQARVGSTRMPGKMILPFHDGKGVLELLLQRMEARFAGRENVVLLVATTVNPLDDAIAAIAEKSGVPLFRGSEEDVLKRFVDAATYAETERLIRVCADNPFLDIDAIEVLLRRIGRQHHDYIAFATSDGTPSIKTHYGFWPEAVRLDALTRVAGATTERIYREHVTNYIYTYPDGFDLDLIPIDREIEEKPNIRLTLDTPEDFEMQQAIYARCLEKYGKIETRLVLQILDAFPGFYEQMKRQIGLNTK